MAHPNESAILCMLEEYYVGTPDEKFTVEECKSCKRKVCCGEIAKRQADKFKVSVKFICNECFFAGMTTPNAKIMRPSQEAIEKLRKEGVEIDEIKIREIASMLKMVNRSGKNRKTKVADGEENDRGHYRAG